MAPDAFEGLSQPFQAGEWQVDPLAGTLSQANVNVHLQPQLMELLLLLVRNRDRVVLKQEILDALWPDIHVSSTGLPRCISQLRCALRDDLRNPIYIETSHKRGYRLIAPVSFRSRVIRFGPFSRKTLGAIAVLLIVGATFLFLVPSSSRSDQPPLVAVLPFASLAPNGETEFLGGIVSAEIIASLSNLSGLRLMASPSSSEISSKSARELVSELKVAAVIQGSVRQTGERIRVTVQLIDAHTRSHVWAATYDREMTEIIEVAWEIAHQVSSALGVELDSSHDPTRGLYGLTAEAHRLSLLARYFRYREAEPDGFEKAVDYYQLAIEKDPYYARAHAGLTQAYLGMDRWGRTREWLEEAEKSAKRALELDSSLAEAHVAMGMIQTLYHRDFEGAETSLRTALASNPHDPDAHRIYGLLLLRHLGRLDEALIELKRARDLDPASPPFSSSLAEVYRARGEYAKAVIALERRLEIDWRTAQGLANMAYTWLLLGHPARAEEWANKSLDLEPGFPPALQVLIYGSLCAGKPDRAAPLVRRLLETHPDDARSLAAAGIVALQLGELTKAREYLEKACRIDPDGWAWPLDIRLATLLGFMLRKTGEQVEAERWLSQSLQLDNEVRGSKKRPLPSWLHNSALVHAIREDLEGGCDLLGRAVEVGWKGSYLNRSHPLWGMDQDTSCVRQLTADVEVDLYRMRESLGSFGSVSESWGPEGKQLPRELAHNR